MRIFKQTTENEENYALLLDDLKKTKSDLDLAYANFENVVDPDLIDSCIYQVNAVQLRYKFLLGRVKQIEDSYAKNPLELLGS
ncbi:MAG: YaaL family protein [Lachnospiraceae bacterium]|nr:YaaL family protein [Lachnospiraceae bacterium]